MKLYYHRNKHGVPNFGDDLNPWLWPRLLPDVLDDDPATMFLGIGTLLNDRLPPAPARVVFGTGYGIGNPPDVTPSWTFYAVRGPISAKQLGLPAECAVTDPGILVSRYAEAQRATPRHAFAFMPHYRNASAAWEAACARLGFGYIDPRRPVEQVLDEIADTKVLLAEAMHGAIIADTLRVPWIPIRSKDKILRLKWEDWCASMEVPYEPQATLTLRQGESFGQRLRTAAKGLLASAQLKRASRAVPTLSRDAVFHRKREMFDALIERLRRDVKAGRFARTASRDRSVAVPDGAESAAPDSFATIIREK